MSYLRTNFKEKTKKVLEEKGFIVNENVRVSSDSTIDMMGTYGTNHYLFEFKKKPISTIDVINFSASIADLSVTGEKKGFIVTDSIETGSAVTLSKKLDIEIVKTNERDVEKTVKKVIEEVS